MIRTIVGSFDDSRAAHRAAEALIADGFMQQDISVVASNILGDYTPDGRPLLIDEAPDTDTATGAVAGGMLGGAAALTASLIGLAIPGLGPVVAFGPLIAMLTGAGAGAVAGGLVGALAHSGVPQEHATYYAESVRRGGALVFLRADDSRAERAAEILREHGAIDLDERVLRWRDTGWRGWDSSAKPYTPEEAERERRLYGTHSDPLSGLPLTSDPEGDNRRESTIRR
jgi:uncharacterized membrane protein